MAAEMKYPGFLQPQTSRYYRWTIRLSLVALGCSLFWLVRHFLDLADQQGTAEYISSNIYNYWHGIPEDGPPVDLSGQEKVDKVIVIAKKDDQDTDWVEQSLPEYVSLCPTAHLQL